MFQKMEFFTVWRKPMQRVQPGSSLLYEADAGSTLIAFLKESCFTLLLISQKLEIFLKDFLFTVFLNKTETSGLSHGQIKFIHRKSGSTSSSSITEVLRGFTQPDENKIIKN